MDFLRVEPLFEVDQGDNNTALYSIATSNLLKKIVPKHIVELCKKDKELALINLRKLMPIVIHSDFKAPPFNLFFILLCPFRPNAFQFLFELVTRWLVPGKRLNVEIFFVTDFRFPDLNNDMYTVGEVTVRLENQKEVETLKKHLPIIETELRLGAASIYHARRILEIKGLGPDEKTARIQENIAAVIKRQRRNIDWDIFSEMQHFLVTCGDKFKAQHEYHYMTRIICFLYLFRKSLRGMIQDAPKKKHVMLKLMNTRLRQGASVRKVLGVLVGMNVIDEHEVFEERHLLKGCASFVPGIKAVEGSFFMHLPSKEPIRMVYLEIEKENGAEFFTEEIKELRKGLPTDLKGRVESLLHPIFMPRNEEEIMRHILTLSSELKFVRDIPEIILSFDEHTATRLSFTVILLRVLKEGSVSIQEMFEKRNSFLEYVPDRIKIVGFLRKKYAKEANVFHVRLDKERFLREDHSVDLYRARQDIVTELAMIVGELRDFNGGMISKQSEVFSFLKDLLGGVAKHHGLLLESFFYSLTPVVMRTLLEPLLLKKLFLFLLDAIEDGIPENSRYFLQCRAEQEAFFVMITALDPGFKEVLMRAIGQLKVIGVEVACVYVVMQEKHYFGLIYRGQEEEKQALFYATCEEVMRNW